MFAWDVMYNAYGERDEPSAAMLIYSGVMDFFWTTEGTEIHWTELMELNLGCVLRLMWAWGC